MKKYVITAILCLFCMSVLYATSEHNNKIRLIRNATLKIEYGDKTILIDPMFGEKCTLFSVLGTNINPRVHLTMPVNEILDEVDFVLLTHTHEDHYDRIAKDTISKDMPFFVQPSDMDSVAVKDGFFKTQMIVDSINVDGISITRIDGSHGRGKLAKMMGNSSGYIIKAEGEPMIYIMGDCMWDDTTKATVAKYNPDYIVVNSGGAIIPPQSNTYGPVLPDEKEVLTMLRDTPSHIKLICVHMDALDHCQTTRSILRNEAISNNVDVRRLIIPEDGETVNLSRKQNQAD